MDEHLAAALVALQADLEPLARTADNPFFKSKYVPLVEVRRTLQPLLAKHKLALLEVPTRVDGGNGLRFVLIHDSGASIGGEWALPHTENPQAEGSAITYLRRYGVMAMLGLVGDEDDDANQASRREHRRRQQPDPKLAAVQTALRDHVEQHNLEWAEINRRFRGMFKRSTTDGTVEQLEDFLQLLQIEQEQT